MNIKHFITHISSRISALIQIYRVLYYEKGEYAGRIVLLILRDGVSLDTTVPSTTRSVFRVISQGHDIGHRTQYAPLHHIRSIDNTAHYKGIYPYLTLQQRKLPFAHVQSFLRDMLVNQYKFFGVIA